MKEQKTVLDQQVWSAPPKVEKPNMKISISLLGKQEKKTPIEDLEGHSNVLKKVSDLIIPQPASNLKNKCQKLDNKSDLTT